MVGSTFAEQNMGFDPTLTVGIKSDSRSWVEKLFDYVNGHVQMEQSLLEDYVSAAAGTQSKALEYLVNLIAEDERRHHRLFQEFARSLQHGLEWTSGGNELPPLDFYKADREAIAAVTRKLLENEETDARELAYLQKMVKSAKDSTLWDLIVELMQRDTEKHIAILRFVEKHLH